MKKVFNTQYNIWRKTLKTIQQLSCFVGHPADSDPSLYRLKMSSLSQSNFLNLNCSLNEHLSEGGGGVQWLVHLVVHDLFSVLF